MGKPNFRGPPYKGEINPLTGKPYSTNPRAHGARWKAWYNKKTPDGRKQGEVWEEWTKTEEYKKSKEYINKKKEAEDRPRHTAQDQGEAVERAKEQMKIPTMKEQIERDKTKINPEDDWQTSPEFDQEGGGWQDEKPLKDLNPRRSNITSTINNALKIGKDIYGVGKALWGLGKAFQLQSKADTTDIVDQLMIRPEIADQVAGIYSSNSAGNEEYWGEVRPKGVNYNISPQQMQRNIDKLKIKIGPIINKAEVDYGQPSDLDKYFEEEGQPTRDMDDEERLRIMRGSLEHA